MPFSILRHGVTVDGVTLASDPCAPGQKELRITTDPAFYEQHADATEP